MCVANLPFSSSCFRGSQNFRGRVAAYKRPQVSQSGFSTATLCSFRPLVPTVEVRIRQFFGHLLGRPAEVCRGQGLNNQPTGQFPAAPQNGKGKGGRGTPGNKPSAKAAALPRVYCLGESCKHQVPALRAGWTLGITMSEACRFLYHNYHHLGFCRRSETTSPRRSNGCLLRAQLEPDEDGRQRRRTPRQRSFVHSLWPRDVGRNVGWVRQGRCQCQ